MDLEIRHLRLIQALAEEGTQTRAARRLFLTQSALSHQLTELERRVGTSLFHRVGRRLALTRAGRRVLEAGEVILPRIGELTEDLRAIAGGVTGQIRVTTQCYTCYNWLPRVLPPFHERFPGVEIQLVPDVAIRAIEALTAGEIDLALAYDFAPEDALETADLWIDEMVAIVHPQHRLAGTAYLEAEDFADEHYLMHVDRIEETYLHQVVLEPAKVRPRRISSLRLTEGIVAMVEAGAGMAVVSRWSVARELAAGRIVAVRVTELGLRRHWRAIRLPGAEADFPLQHFVDLLRNGPAHLFEAKDEGRLRALAGFASPP